MAQLSHITTSSPRVITGICSRKVVVVVVAAAAAVPTVVATVLVLLARAETIIAFLPKNDSAIALLALSSIFRCFLRKTFMYCHARIIFRDPPLPVVII